MGAKENIAALRRALEAWSSPSRREEYFDLYSPDAEIHVYGVSSVAGLRPLYSALWTAFPDAEAIIEDTVAEEDKLAYRVIVRGTHRGSFQGLAPTGKRVSISQVGILEFAQGKVIRRWGQDTLPAAILQLQD